MCIICSGKIKKPARYGKKELDCNKCKIAQKIPLIEGFEVLNCHSMYRLAEISTIKGLRELDVSYCLQLPNIPNIPGLKILKCNYTRNLREIPLIQGLEELYAECLFVKELPVIPGLKILRCDNNQNLISIPNIPSLEKLSCSSCPEIQEIPNIPHLVELNCQKCYGLTKICDFTEMKILQCSCCSSLKEISNMPKLVELHCSFIKLEKICIPGLRKLYCNNCENLKEVLSEKLYLISCFRCPVLTKIPDTQCIHCSKFNWLEKHENFGTNISQLIKIQKHVKKYHKLRMCKKWVNSDEFREWYYHPEGPGGIKAVLRLNKFIKND